MSNRRGSTRSRLHLCVGHASRVWVGGLELLLLSNGIAWVYFASMCWGCKWKILPFALLAIVRRATPVRPIASVEYYSQFAVRSPVSLSPLSVELCQFFN